MRLIIATSAPDAQLADSLGDLRYRLDRRLSGNGVKIFWRIALRDMPDIPAPARLQLMRVVQESLTNALRHSGASILNVGATYEPADHELTLWVEDNGQGFDTGNPPAGGRGLRNLRHRSAQIGATVRIDSTAGGTRVELAWPLPATSRPDLQPASA